MDVASYIFNLKEGQQKIALLLQQEILNFVPGIVEKMAYKIPFYYYHGPLLYLNPKKNGIDVGFTKGYLFRHGLENLDDKNRKQVRSYFVASLEDYNPEVFFMLLNEALEINKIAKGLGRG